MAPGAPGAEVPRIGTAAYEKPLLRQGGHAADILRSVGSTAGSESPPQPDRSSGRRGAASLVTAQVFSVEGQAHNRVRPCEPSRSILLHVILGRPDARRPLFCLLDELLDAGRTAEQVTLPADDPG